MTSATEILADLEQPILFRTSGAAVYRAALETGSLWLRSAAYYQAIEDRARQDSAEGFNASRTTVPLRVGNLSMFGDGLIGQTIRPHYILSLHGTSISRGQLQAFGGHTFGVKNLFKLTMEIFHETSKVIDCSGFRYGAVSYQHTALMQTASPIGGAPVQLADNRYLNVASSDVLRKLPIEPFIQQDEWRIVLFTNGYLDSDPNAPLRINVQKSHFYPFQFALEPAADAARANRS